MLSLTVAPPEVTPNGAINFTLSLFNSGSLTATNVVLTDSLSTFLDKEGVVAEGIVITDTGHIPSYVWAVQDLAPGQNGVITVTGVLTTTLPAGTYTNTASIAATNDLIPDNNVTSATFTVNLSKVFLPIVRRETP